MTFGQNMALVRKKRGLTQDQLGDRIGLKGDMVSKYERDTMAPSIEVAAKIAQALNISLDHLVAGTTDDKNQDETDKLILQLQILPAGDKAHIVAVIDAFVTKAKLQSIVGQN